MKNLAVFASGGGSNFEALAKAAQTGELPAKIPLLVCDNPLAKVIDRAKKYGTKVLTFSPKDFPSKEAYEMLILNCLKEQNVDFIALAGYMRLVGKTLLEPYENKIVNIHPSLLPAFPGVESIKRAFDAGVKVTGVTIHYVDEGIDTGEIIAQQPVEILESDTLASLERKIHEAEHSLYVRTLKELL